ncbi:MAG: excalibur calcium-binding domain-containing protein [Micropruina sp.]
MRKTIGSVIVGCVLVALPLGAVSPVVAEAAPQAGTLAAPKAQSVSKASVYTNCTALNKKYGHGVGKAGAKDKVSGRSKPVTNFTRSTKIYKEAMSHNRGLDRDKDGVACEKR